MSQVGEVAVLEIRHENVGARVEGIDDHLAIDRASDLDTAVLRRSAGAGAHPPVIFSDLARLLKEAGEFPAVEPQLARFPPLQQLETTGVESAMQHGQELDGIGSDDLLESRPHRPANLDTVPLHGRLQTGDGSASMIASARPDMTRDRNGIRFRW